MGHTRPGRNAPHLRPADSRTAAYPERPARSARGAYRAALPVPEADGMSESPTSRTMRALREDGWTVHRAECYNAYARRRYDFGGFADIVAWQRSGGILAIQCTTMDNRTKRLEKVRTSREAVEWKAAGGKVQIWSWRKLQVGRRRLWRAHIDEC